MKQMVKLNLETVDQSLREYAQQAWKEGDIHRVMNYMPNTSRLGFLVDNILPLTKAEKYEDALFCAYTGTRTNFSNWSLDVLTYILNKADPVKMRSLGSSIPDLETFTLYRGVAGRGRKRRVNGFSWTESPHIAAWFACRYPELPDPAVYRVAVTRDQILFCCDERKEKEFVLRLPLRMKPKRVLPMPEPHLER
jgi:hypothetical protein